MLSVSISLYNVVYNQTLGHVLSISHLVGVENSFSF